MAKGGKKDFSLAVCMCVHDDNLYLPHALASAGNLTKLVFISKLSWSGEEGDWQTTKLLAESAGAEVILGEWLSEEAHREAVKEECQKRGIDFALILDSDEVLEPKLLSHLIKVAEADLADRVYVTWDTYWKSPEYVVRPRERFTPCILIHTGRTTNTRNRDLEGGRPLFLGEEYGIIHHLSYAGSDARIYKKITSWGHKNEVISDWWESVWKGWDANPLMRDIHPTHPPAYGWVEHTHVPEILSGIPYDKPKPLKLSKPKAKASIIIPAYGGQDDLDACLQSLKASKDLIHEIIVVDNASSPPIKVPKGVKLIRNKQNKGFAKASNQGYGASKGEITLFLNSDTIVPRTGLTRLLEAFDDQSIAAAGPLTNNSGHFQRIDVNYTSISTLDLFATDFAQIDRTNIEIDMLVGFCLAVRKSILDEIGAFDERFGIGMFEDNDLCYRLRRNGHKLVIATKAFVHHHGSKTFGRMEQEEKNIQTQKLLQENLQKFTAKWKEDLDTGYATSLSGLSAEPITFKTKPLTQEELSAKKDKADITLCMIVKNEERVLKDCLQSAKPYFKHIHVLDTGSTDRTCQIVEEEGVTLRKFTWKDSFALARTASMRHAKSKWVMWMDADDTLPPHCGEIILDVALNAADDAIGFVVPVRFVETDGMGTQVDHVKLIRNLPGLEWEGRIHEQILPSLRRQADKAGIQDPKILRTDAYVLHSGYDTSDAGQARKRERDEKLLKLDLKDRPNHPFVLFNLGMTAHFTGDANDAIKWLEKCLKYSKETESHVRKAYALLGASYRMVKEPDKARKTLEAGLTQYPRDPEIQFHLAQLSAERGEHQVAIEYYEDLLMSDISGVFTSLDPGITGYKALHNLALSHMETGSYEKARFCWKDAYTRTKKPELAITLFEAAAEQGDLETCKELVVRIEQDHGHGEEWAKMLSKLQLRFGIETTEVLSQAVEANPQLLSVRKELAMLLLNLDRKGESIEHLNLLQQAGIAEGAYFLGVLSEENNEVDKALRWYMKSSELSPGHSQTISAISRLNSAV